MIELIEIKKACNDILRAAFPGIKIYGPDTTGALKRPSFYTEIVPYTFSYETVNRVSQSCGFKITLMEEVTNEDFELNCFAKIRKAFGLKLPIGKRKLTISEVESEYIGAKNDIFQMTLRFEWYDSITEHQEYDLMQDIAYNTKMKGN